MSILIGNFVIILALAVVSYILPIKKKYKNRFFIIWAFIQILIIRTFVDIYSLPDLSNYQQLFYDLNFYDIKSLVYGMMGNTTEIGFVLLLKTISVISKDFTFVLFVISFIWIYAYIYFFRNYTLNIYIPILLLLVTEFPQSLFVLRQHLSMAILLFSIQFILQRKIGGFVAILVLATIIHKTALIFSPIYFFYGIQSKKNMIIAIFLTSIAITYIFSSLGFLNDIGSLGYGNYIDGERAGASNFTNFFKFLMYIIPFYFLYRKQIFDDGILKLIFIIVALGTIISFTGTTFSLTGRIIRYFTPACLLLVPYVVKRLSDNVLGTIYIIILLALNFVSIFYGSMSDHIRNYDFLPFYDLNMIG